MHFPQQQQHNIYTKKKTKKASRCNGKVFPGLVYLCGLANTFRLFVQKQGKSKLNLKLKLILKMILNEFVSELEFSGKQR